MVELHEQAQGADGDRRFLPPWPVSGVVCAFHEGFCKGCLLESQSCGTFLRKRVKRLVRANEVGKEVSLWLLWIGMAVDILAGTKEEAGAGLEGVRDTVSLYDASPCQAVPKVKVLQLRLPGPVGGGVMIADADAAEAKACSVVDHLLKRSDYANEVSEKSIQQKPFVRYLLECMDDPKIGAQLFTLREYTQSLEEFRATCQRLFEIGYRAMQVSALGKDLKAGEVAEAARSCGLKIAATHVSWERCLTELPQVIAEHRLWGCEHTAIGSVPRERYFSLEGARRFVEEAGPVCERLADAGISFSHHNHHWEFAHYAGKAWLERVMELSEGSALGFELDVHWIMAGGADPVDWISRAAGRVPLLHCKDFVVTEQGERRFAPVGAGNMNWTAILRAAEASSVQWYLIEQDDCYGADPFECLAESFANLNGFLAEVL